MATARTGAHELDLQDPTTVHLVGIGGAGMSGLARILVQRGHVVTGSDLKDSRRTHELRAMGATVTIGHDAANVTDQDVVVVSSAVHEDNPEVVAATTAAVPVVHRADLLHALMARDRRVLVAGTHGKTTTTSMLVVGLHAVGVDPSFSIGAQLNEAGTNAHAGTDPVFVAEADESDRSLLVFRPHVAIVTNAELDHPDTYASEDEVLDVFATFLGRREPDGLAVVGVDDPGGVALAGRVDGPVATYGIAPSADYQLVPEGPRSGTVLHDDHELATLALGVPGQHNLVNATAAIAVAHHLGHDPRAVAAGLGVFQGAARRFQVVGREAGVTVVDDYAHHPTELRATLAAARAHTDGRVLVVVQPHRYSRTREFGPELGRAAAAADRVWVTDVYGSGESPEPGVSGRLVAEAAEAAGARVTFQPHFTALVAALAAEAERGDLVLVTGAGDISQVGAALVHALAGDDGGR
ncbi:UDP-N-acetylmuramate--L-alanine ligase [Salsipaludibacter albus]|uniref:UDP-N-acetylmuramate--L-alanine ligase n=1 Tax=Salsipaludibacter albus TaxID=2849650 RepID=UPI001EE4D6E4|nr:UDP-N-acetylmuramate--L-alanine ligase [Salsipaludibacter albus]MBY5163215.1 UDP-N-acetylmuramate--L-alanine ligase [Salsipaludibacter albus]